MPPTAEEQALLRADGHKARFYLSISQPRTLLTAKVNNAAIVRGAQTIAYDNGAGSGFAAIKAGQTLLVETATGVRNVRVRSVTGSQASGTFTVAANSILWADNQDLTVLEDYELRTVPPRFDDSDFRKDWDIAYSNQNSQPPPVCIAGPHRAIFVEPGQIISGSVEVRIAAGADDGIIASDGSVLLPSVAENPFSYNGIAYNWSWFRFIDLSEIPSGATVTNAYIRFRATANDAGSITYRIYGDDSDSATAPTTPAEYLAKSLTDDFVSWPIGNWVNGADYTTPDISPAIQDIVDRPGFDGVIQLLFRDASAAGIVYKPARAYDGDPNLAPLLYIEYQYLSPLVTVDVDLSHSYAMAQGAAIASYGFSVTPSAGVTTSFSTVTGVGTATVTTPGQYWFEYSCTDTNGQTQVTRRRVIVHDPDPASADYPYTDFSVDGFSGDWERGGWNLDITVNGVADRTQIPDNALVILWYESWYGDTKQYIGGPVLAPQVLFCGYIRKGSIVANWDRGTVSFEASTAEGLLREHFLRSVPLQAVASPGEWYEYPLWLTPGRAVHHLWRWHSTLFEVADVYGLADSSLRRKYCDFPKGNLYNQADSLLRLQSIAAHVVCDKTGRIHVVRDIQLLDDAARAAAPIIANLTKADRRGDLTILQGEETVAYLRVSGLSFDGSAVNAYVSRAPGDVPAERGPGDNDIDNQVVESQEHTNNLAGRYHAVANNKEPEARAEFAGLYAGLLDIHEPAWWTLDVAAGDTPRGIVWTNKHAVCRTVNLTIDNANGMITCEAVYEPEAEGPPGIPETYTTPTVPAPPAPRWEAGTPALVALGSLYYRDDNDADWTQHSTESFDHIAVDPWWKIKQQTEHRGAAILWGAGNGVIKRSLDAGRSWDDRTPVNNPPNTWGDSPAPTVASLAFTQALGDPWTRDRFFALAAWQNGSGSWRAWLLGTEDDGRSWVYYPLYDGVTLPDQVRPLWSAINGSHVLVTTWQDLATDGLRLHQRNASTLAYAAEISLGAATLSELNSRTYWAFPVTVLDNDALWHVAGRVNAPAGLAGVQHVISYDGATWTSLESGWGVDHCAACWVGLLSGGNREYKAVRQPG